MASTLNIMLGCSQFQLEKPSYTQAREYSTSRYKNGVIAAWRAQQDTSCLPRHPLTCWPSMLPQLVRTCHEGIYKHPSHTNVSDKSNIWDRTIHKELILLPRAFPTSFEIKIHPFPIPPCPAARPTSAARLAATWTIQFHHLIHPTCKREHSEVLTEKDRSSQCLLITNK